VEEINIRIWCFSCTWKISPSWFRRQWTFRYYTGCDVCVH